MEQQTSMTGKSLPAIGALIDQTIKFYQANWKVFAPVLVIAVIPSLIIEFISTTQLHGYTSTNPLMLTRYGGESPALAGVITILAIAHIVLQIWSGTAVFYLLKKITEGQPAVDFASAFRNSLPYVIPLTITEIITGLIIFAGFILLIIPGIIFLVWGFAVAYVYIFEGIPYYAAFQRSRALVAGHWSDVFWRLIVMGLIIIVISVILSIIPFIGSLVTPLVVTPVGLYYGYLLYKSLKQIKEGTA